jgi:membrane-associated protein
MHLTDTILTFGYIGIFLVLFAESGFFLGFFLPGDSLLFALGIAASLGHFSIGTLIAVAVAAAILGDSFGYWSGKYFGEKLFRKADARFLKPVYVERTKVFYEKYGKKTIILSRFVPIVRTFAPILAGVAKMPYGIFLTYNIIGGIMWAAGILSLSYVLGKSIPGIENYLGYIIVAIIVVSFIPPVLEFLKEKKAQKKKASL